MSLKLLIQKMVEDKIKFVLQVGKVKAFDPATMTCTVDLTTGPDILNVRVKASITDDAKGILIRPKVDSIVVVGLLDNNDASAVILAYTEIDTLKWVTEDKIIFQSDSFGGLVIAEKVYDQIKEVKDDLNKLKQAFATWVPAPTDGGAALKAALASYASSTLTVKAQTYYESTRTYHGE